MTLQIMIVFYNTYEYRKYNIILVFIFYTLVNKQKQVKLKTVQNTFI